MPDEEIEQLVNKDELVPVHEVHAFGRLRWAIERYCPPEKLKELGRFTKLYDETGTKILRDFPGREFMIISFGYRQRRTNTVIWTRKF